MHVFLSGCPCVLSSLVCAMQGRTVIFSFYFHFTCYQDFIYVCTLTLSCAMQGDWVQKRWKFDVLLIDNLIDKLN